MTVHKILICITELIKTQLQQNAQLKIVQFFYIFKLQLKIVQFFYIFKLQNKF